MVNCRKVKQEKIKSVVFCSSSNTEIKQVGIIHHSLRRHNLKSSFNFPGLGPNRSLGEACRHVNPVCPVPQK